jgi:hypothetical protein
MIRIAITQAAFDAITETLPIGSVMYETQPGQRRRAVHLARAGCAQQVRRSAPSRRELQRGHPTAGRDRGALALAARARGRGGSGSRAEGPLSYATRPSNVGLHRQ